MKLTVKQIKIKLKKKNLLLKSKYKDAHSKIKVSCIKCKEGKKAYKITAQQAWDRGCKFCNLKNLYKILEKKVYLKRRITNKEFKKRLHSELKSHTTYINNDTHLIIECLKCGNKKPTIPLHLLDGKHHCNICGPKKTGKKKQVKFLKKLDKRLKENNIIRISEYNGKRKPIKLECFKCNHKWEKKKAGTGLSACPECSHKELGLNNRLTEKTVKKVLDIKSIKLVSKYVGTLEPAKLKCLHCGIDWSVKRLSATLYVYKGCTRCSKRYNGAYSKKLFKIKPSLKNSIGKTYFLKCTDKKESFYKVGITRQVWRERMRKIPYDVKIIEYYKGVLPKCVDLEISLKKDYKKFSYRPMKYFGGVAECFKFNKKQITEIKSKLKETV